MPVLTKIGFSAHPHPTNAKKELGSVTSNRVACAESVQSLAEHSRFFKLSHCAGCSQYIPQSFEKIEYCTFLMLSHNQCHIKKFGGPRPV